MEQITKKMLQLKVDYLNKITDNPETPWSRDDDGNLKANIGNYHLSGAYGGVNVEQMMNDGGGVHCPINYGHIPKRDLFEKLSSFINGYELAIRNQDVTP